LKDSPPEGELINSMDGLVEVMGVKPPLESALAWETIPPEWPRGDKKKGGGAASAFENMYLGDCSFE
jgi:hypothetical protein